MTTNEQSGAPDLLPDHYLKSRFWRFLLDTREDALRPDEPRFKQFSDNLRNYAVAAVMFKAAGSIPMTVHHPALALGRIVLTLAATVATAFSTLQQFAFLNISSHWFLGWDTLDHIFMNRTKEGRQIYIQQGVMRRPRLKLYGSIAITALVLWAMLAFVMSPIL